MLDRLIKFFTSLKLTVALLTLGLVLVFLGTVAQEPLGLYAAQNRFFRSFFVDASSLSAGFHKCADMLLQPLGYPLQPLNAHELLTAKRIPAFPGGYLIGGLLLINLVAAHLRYYQPSKKKIGIVMIHFGVVLLLVGQLLTDFLSTESSMHLRVGGTKNYSEADRRFEMAVVDVTEKDSDKVFVIKQDRLARKDSITHPDLPFSVRAKTYYANSALAQKAEEGFEPVTGVSEFAGSVWMKELPHETMMDRRDTPTAIVEIAGSQGSVGTFLVSALMGRAQRFNHGDRTYEIALRPERHYKPFSLHLKEFSHDKYPGTEIPKNFSSRVLLDRPDTGERREVLIYMNNPLRYWGETYYQASFDRDDQGSVLQVVRNPSWLTPYFSCVLVALGMMVQFLTHLVPFLKRRMAT